MTKYIEYQLKPATVRAIKKYGFDVCLKAWHMNEQGNGAAYVAFCCDPAIKTTNQADAAINAGLDIVRNDKSGFEEGC